MGWESSHVDRLNLDPLVQGQTMVHWLWRVVFPEDTNLVCGLVIIVSIEASGGYFGLAFTMPLRVEKFSMLTLSEENYTN